MSGTYSNDIAAIAYEAYRRSIMADCPAMPPYEELQGHVKDAWLSSALAVTDYLSAMPKEGRK